MLLKPLLDDDQWRVMSSLELTGKASNIVAMPGTRLQHWCRDAFDGLVASSGFANAAQTKFARSLAHQFHKATIALALVKIEGDNKHLGMAITDDAMVTNVLNQRGVNTMTWSDALDYLRRDQASSLIDMTENSVACGRARLATKVHTEEAHLKVRIAKQLHLAWPDELDPSELDADAALLVKAEIEERKSKFAIFRDVALSRIISVPQDEQIDRDMQSVFDTSDVDFLIHGKAPHNIPLLAVEYDGNVHRNDPDKIITDRAKDRLLAAAGIGLVRIGTHLARAYGQGQVLQPQHQRLLPMLGIARAILERRVILKSRADQDRGRLLRDVSEANAIASALYDKKMPELDGRQQLHAFDIQQSARQLERWLTDADRAAEDLDDEIGDRLESQLEALGLDPACVSHVSIRSTFYGAVGTARLQLKDGSAIRSLETAAVSLHAPFLPSTTVDQLIKMQIYAELAYAANKLANAA